MPWVLELKLPATRESAAVRRYPVREELGGVLGRLLGLAEDEEDLAAEAEAGRLREAG